MYKPNRYGQEVSLSETVSHYFVHTLLHEVGDIATQIDTKIVHKINLDRVRQVTEYLYRLTEFPRVGYDSNVFTGNEILLLDFSHVCCHMKPESEDRLSPTMLDMLKQILREMKAVTGYQNYISV
jgi:hypothetical protein